MKILLIEDEDRSIRQTTSAIKFACSHAQITLAQFREQAISKIQNDVFDLIICDLRIPPTENSADISESHGFAVHGVAREICPGTPLVFLTAFATTKNTKDKLASGGTDSIFGIEEYPLVQLVEKDDVEELEELILTLSRALSELDDYCNLDAGGVEDIIFQRAVRTYAKKIKHNRAIVQKATGLSGATIGRVKFVSEDLSEANIFIKVLDRAEASEEYSRFNEFVPNHLQPGFFAPSIPPMMSGLRKKAALISTLASADSKSFFYKLNEDPNSAVEILRTLREAMTKWIGGDTKSLISLRELRQDLVSDERLNELDFALDRRAQEREERMVVIRKTIVHGDLHGENILIDKFQRPILIDFGDVGNGLAPVDPVTLELSIIFHDQGSARESDWADRANWSNWANLDAYCESNPYADFIRECRGWALDVDSVEATLAFTYAHAMRQLKYSDVPDELALAVADSALTQLESLQDSGDRPNI
ncbi:MULTISPECIES: phosphotransferase [Rhodococcus]|uniref:Phosphotransferase n=1 Tax=Rhodococcus qingshengii JCM 15477 TaxID=1303681 RepID=A0AB38RMD4_RHOSG|nr:MULTISPECIES: phosphotransferase [Rhodococcus]UPU46221.1 phosphotransferase [Rhodococcus qingshengii JCM 15477]